MKVFAKYLALGVLMALPTVGIIDQALAQVQTGDMPGCGQPCKNVRYKDTCTNCCFNQCGQDDDNAIVKKCKEWCENNLLPRPGGTTDPTNPDDTP